LAIVVLGCAAAVVHVISVLAQRPVSELLGNRQEFTSQGCVALEPTGNDRHATVFLDPGHGGPDPGASGTAPDGTVLQEKRLTLAVAHNMLLLLRSAGYRVVLSRLADTSVAQPGAGDLVNGVYTTQGEHADIEARIDCANTAQAQLLLSIHFNAAGDASAGGSETTYDPSRAFSAQSRHFADLIQRAVLSGFASQGWTVPDRGVIPDTQLGTPALTPQAAAYGHLLELGPAAAGWLAHPSAMPGALCEPLFLTDPGEAAVAESQQGQQVLAHALSHAIDQYFHAA
jgi:N-acetylmuramoyl-L-alanine amidase